MRYLLAIMAIGACCSMAFSEAALAEDKVSQWNGYERRDFAVDGRSALLIVPKKAADSKPWIWRTEFFGHEPQADLALLEKGFHVAYVDVQNLYGAPKSLDHMDKFYEHLTTERGLAKQTVLEGFSRGGLFALNWGARHPERVACMYNDAPVCDFKSWPGGKGKGPGSAADWKRCLEAYGLTEAEALEYKLNPVDNLKPLADAKVPLLHVCGDADEVVPFDENTQLLAERYKTLGGEIVVIAKPGVKHHPHSLKDPAPIVAFVLKHTLKSALCSLSLTSPRDWQVAQRSSLRSGKLAIAGQLTPQQVAPSILQAQVHDRAGKIVAQWQPLPYDPRVAAFAGELEVPAGGWYRVVVQAKLQEVVLAETVVEHVGLGEVFVIAGQSNSANHGESKQQTRSEQVSSFTGSQWQLAHDPQPGASGGGGSFVPAFGDALHKELGVPIGIIAVGAGGTSVREWLPRGAKITNLPTVTAHIITVGKEQWICDGALFRNLVERAASVPNVRAVLWHQGESDANQRDHERTLSGERYEACLTEVIAQFRRQLGREIPWFVAQASYHTPDDTGSPEIRAAQAALWKAGVALAGPDTDALTGALRENNGQGVHLSAAGLQKHGELWAEKVAAWLKTTAP